MSIIKSIKQVLGLSGTASENHFWDGSVANQLSLKRGTPEAPGAELINIQATGVAGIQFASPTVVQPNGNTLNAYSQSGLLTGTTGVISELGTLTAYSWRARYVRIGKKVFADLELMISDFGTGAGGLIINLQTLGMPVPVSDQASSGAGRNRTNGSMVQGAFIGSDVFLFKYDNTTTIGNFNIQFSIAYDTNAL